MNKSLKHLQLWGALLGLALVAIALPPQAAAQNEDQGDPPTRAARLGYMQGSVSFEPAGEDEWVGAVWNRPLTTGDKLWSDAGSRAALQLGSASIRLSDYTGISFLNLDDDTVQVQLSSGTVNVRVWQLSPGDDFEIDTPNLAFVITSPGSYRIYADQDGSDTTVAVRSGDGQATGNGQTYTLQAGQVGYFSGTESLDADVEDIGPPDSFDTWADGRDRRYEQSRSAQYVSRDVVGYEDLDEYGDWRDDPSYGHVWFPNRVAYGWAPYHEGHWVWIDPWGYTWVDDNPWGYAPFHYGRWVFISGRWGWIAGPPAVAPVYAPALVVFVGGGGGWGGNIGWFPLGPREVYVPSYPVSQTYMTQINVSNTNVSTTTVTNVYNTTIVNKTTTITNVTYVNRTVPGAVTAVPQGAFTSAQSVARVAVKVTPQQIASAPVTSRVGANPTRQAVLGAKASTAGHVAAPPAAVMNRQVVAKKTPPPPPPPMSKQLQAMAAHPGQPLPRQEMASLRPPASMHPAAKVAPPGEPAVPTTGHAPAPRPGQPAAAHAPALRAAQPAPAAKQPENRPPTAPANREPNRPPVAQPNRPEMNRPTEAPAHPPAAQPNRPEPARPAAPPQQHAAPPARPAPQQPHPPAAKPTPPPQKKLPTPEEKKQEQQKPPGE